jgi:hypothetical protein
VIMSNSLLNTEQRLDRLESLDEIRQLVAKYALAVDMRHLGALVGLYTEDVRTGRNEVGRGALWRYFQTVLAQFDSTAHHIGNHIIEFADLDQAEGLLYCDAQLEMGGRWMVAQSCYHDHYTRQKGRWLFSRRTPLLWYASELGKAPIGPDKVRWPGTVPIPGTMHAYSPAWETSKTTAPVAESAVFATAQIDRFLDSIRGGTQLPKAQVPRLSG